LSNLFAVHPFRSPDLKCVRTRLTVTQAWQVTTQRTVATATWHASSRLHHRALFHGEPGHCIDHLRTPRLWSESLRPGAEGLLQVRDFLVIR